MKRLITILYCALGIVCAAPAVEWSQGPLGAQASFGGQVVAPTASFRSTSAMTGSNSMYSAHPMLSEDGVATYGSAPTTSTHGSTGPRRADAIDPSQTDEEFPIGDGLWILLAFAGAYLLTRYARRRA